MTRLPILLSVAHSGLDIPPEVADRIALSAEEIAADGDGGARAIYDLGAQVAAFVRTDVARAVVDQNRARDDRTRADGVVKTHTCWNVPVWREPLDEATVERLLAHYWDPYHERLAAAARRPGILLGVDGHTMAAAGPPIGPDPGAPRPLVCLSDGDGTACPRDWVEELAANLETSFGAGAVAINRPFRGGHIVRTHSRCLPWVQLELSRAPFRSEEEKREGVLHALERWCARR